MIVFWPRHLKAASVLYGWNTEDSIFVVGGLAEKSQVRMIEMLKFQVEQLAALYDKKVPIEDFEPRLVTLTGGRFHINCDVNGNSMSFKSLKVCEKVISDTKVILYDLPNIARLDSLILKGNASNSHIDLVKNVK